MRERHRDWYLRNRDPIGADRMRWRAHAFRQLVHLLPGQTILELGRGEGTFTRQLVYVSRGENPITAVTFDSGAPRSIYDASVTPIVATSLPGPLEGQRFDLIVGMDLARQPHRGRDAAAGARAAQPGRAARVLREQSLERRPSRAPRGGARDRAARPANAHQPAPPLRADVGGRLHPRVRGVHRLRVRAAHAQARLPAAQSLDRAREHAGRAHPRGHDSRPRAEAPARARARADVAVRARESARRAIRRDPLPQRGDERPPARLAPARALRRLPARDHSRRRQQHRSYA